MTGFEIDPGGELKLTSDFETKHYDWRKGEWLIDRVEGMTEYVATLALARFAREGQLAAEKGAWAPTLLSGEPEMGPALEDGRGAVIWQVE